MHITHTLRRLVLAGLSALMSLGVLPAPAAVIDGWTTYLSFYDPSDAVEVDGCVYSVMDGSLLAYDTETTEVRTLDRLSAGLSDQGISLIAADDEHHALVIVYSNGNIDILDTRDWSVQNIPQFANNPDDDFALNALSVRNGDALLATNEGVIWIDINAAVIIGRYTVGASVGAVISDGILYVALMERGIISISTDDNLLDRSRWATISDLKASSIAANAGAVYITVPSAYDADNCGLWGIPTGGDWKRMYPYNIQRVREGQNRVIAYCRNYDILNIVPESPLTFRRVCRQNVWASVSPAADGGYWCCTAGEGFAHYVSESEVMSADCSLVGGFGPPYNLFYSTRFLGDRMYAASGRLDPTDRTHYPFHAFYTDDFDTFTSLETPTEAAGWLHRTQPFQDATTVAVDPLDADHIFVSSGRQGLFEYRGDRIVAQYTHGNSPLVSAAGNGSLDYVRTDAATFDAQGNLFVANLAVDTVLWALTPSGEWINFYNVAIRYAGWFEKTLIDQKGRLWLCQRRTDGNLNGGFLCLDYGGTIADKSDDVYTYRSSFTNQDGTAFTFQAAYCIAEDKDGMLWLGTDQGLLRVDNPDEWTDPGFLITQVKVPRNDGTNYADYLLSGAAITAIAVDGANRKWIGTGGDGVYFVSADGTVILQHFTTDNSPLLSNSILSIACHPHNGEVYIGTSLGLVSYRSDASEAQESLSRDYLRVYPNPVRPDYSGPIILDGLPYESDIKVVSTSGHTVAAGTSVGGTFTWDGRGPSGQRVGSGVYYFMIATADGRTTTVAKVAVVR